MSEADSPRLPEHLQHLERTELKTPPLFLNLLVVRGERGGVGGEDTGRGGGEG